MKNQEEREKKNNDAHVKNDARARKSFFFFEVKKKKSMRGQKMTRAETRKKVLFFWPKRNEILFYVKR